MLATGTFPCDGRSHRLHALSGHDHDPTALRRFLFLGMVVLVPCLGPHERVSAGVLLPAAGRSGPGVGSRFRLDQYLHLAVRGPAADNQQHNLDNVNDDNNDDNNDNALSVRLQHLPMVVE